MNTKAATSTNNLSRSGRSAAEDISAKIGSTKALPFILCLEPPEDVKKHKQTQTNTIKLQSAGKRNDNVIERKKSKLWIQ